MSLQAHPPAPSAVFVGCARNCAQHLEGVLANVDRAAAALSRSAVVLVENDSADSTKAMLRRWLAARPMGQLVELDGLATRVPGRTARIAEARNAYLDLIGAGPLRRHEYLVVLDCDEPNVKPWSEAGWSAALEYLRQHPAVSAVFAGSHPVYYDIWALRHPGWCPGDCWQEVRENRGEAPAIALERHVYSRQIELPEAHPPIRVLSAFNGLAIYRMEAALSARYSGVGPTGEEVCEHVAYNAAVGRYGELYVLPALQTAAPQEHQRPQSAVPPGR